MANFRALTTGAGASSAAAECLIVGTTRSDDDAVTLYSVIFPLNFRPGRLIRCFASVVIFIKYQLSQTNRTDALRHAQSVMH